MVEALEQHICIIHKQDEFPHECHVCHKRFVLESGLAAHFRIHDIGAYNKPHQCELCPQAFRRSDALKQHVRTVHLREKRFVCDQCPMAYGHGYQLKAHVNNFHLKRHKCEFCPLDFGQRGLLNEHFRSVHLKEKHLKCDVCLQTFGQMSSFSRHYNTHVKSRRLADKTNAQIAFQSEVQKVVVEMEDMTDFIIKKEPVEEDTEIDDDSLL